MLHDSLQPELSTSFDVGPPPFVEHGRLGIEERKQEGPSNPTAGSFFEHDQLGMLERCSKLEFIVRWRALRAIG